MLEQGNGAAWPGTAFQPRTARRQLGLVSELECLCWDARTLHSKGREGRHVSHITLSFSLQSFGLMLPSPFPSRALTVSRADALREAPHSSLSDPLFLLLGFSEK